MHLAFRKNMINISYHIYGENGTTEFSLARQEESFMSYQILALKQWQE